MRQLYYNIFQIWNEMCPGISHDGILILETIVIIWLIVYEVCLAQGVVANSQWGWCSYLNILCFRTTMVWPVLVAELTKVINWLSKVPTDYIQDIPMHKDTELIRTVSRRRMWGVYNTIDKVRQRGRRGMGSKLHIAKQNGLQEYRLHWPMVKRNRVYSDLLKGKSVGTKNYG